MSLHLLSIETCRKLVIKWDKEIKMFLVVSRLQILWNEVVLRNVGRRCMCKLSSLRCAIIKMLRKVFINVKLSTFVSIPFVKKNALQFSLSHM